MSVPEAVANFRLQRRKRTVANREMSPRPLSKEEKAKLFAAKTHLLLHLHEDLPQEKLCRIAGLGRRKLKEGFVELFGRLPMAYLYETRLQFGLFLLRHTDKTIKEIAAICGYRERSNFSRAFKQFFGVTPGSVPREGF